MFSCRARHAGGRPLTSASSSAMPPPIAMTISGILKAPKICFSAPRIESEASRWPSPTSAANRHSASASISTSVSTLPSEKPSVFSTASSGVRSRTDCIIVFAVRNSSVNSTAPTIALAMKLMSPSCLSCICASADSVCVRVSYEEFANSASICLRDLRRLVRILDADEVVVNDVAAESAVLLEVAVVEVERGEARRTPRRRTCRRCRTSRCCRPASWSRWTCRSGCGRRSSSRTAWRAAR